MADYEKYLNWKKTLQELLVRHEKFMKRLSRASFTSMGDIQNEIDNIEDQIDELSQKVREYEAQNGDILMVSTSTSKRASEQGDDIVDNRFFELQSLLVKLLKLSDNHRLVLDDISDQISKGQLNQEVTLTKLNEIEELIGLIKDELPSEVVDIINENRELDDQISIESKFKFILPLIPFLLNYEFETKKDFIGLIKSIWNDMRNGDIFIKNK